MSRSTTEVGLTDAARAFTATLEHLGDHVGDKGMFGEPISMGRWRDAEGHEYVEVTQDAPWSSGPCVLTCLEWHPRGEEKGATPPDEADRRLREALSLWSERGATAEEAAAVEEMLDSAGQRPTRLFQWVVDPTAKGGWEYRRGVYWI